NDDVAVTFINSSTAVGGRTNAVKRIVDQRQSGLGMPKWIEQRARAIPSNNQIWGVASTVGLFDNLNPRDFGNFGNIAQFLRSVEVAVAQIDASNGIKGQMDAQSNSPENARRLKDALRGAIGFARLNTPTNQEQLLRVYDGIDTVQEDKRVVTKIDIPANLVDEVVELGRSRRQR
ncbi:MAG TPA: hypothetical protein VE621_08770, partial [Bryobacteraceae bacterium]|nr:hypothetical protein [Bryobacteraceae bacterium]